MSNKPHLRTWVGASLAASLAAASLAFGAPAAHAAPSLGKLSITPATGNEITALSATTSAHCNVGDTGINVYVNGPGVSPGTDILQGFTAIDQVDGTDGLAFTVTGIFRDVWQNNSIADPSGTYTVRVACVGADFFTETGEFTQSVTMTPNSNPNGADYVFAASGASTTTTLDPVTPVDPIAHGTDSTLTAHVTSGEGEPAGSVQFKSGNANLGAAVALVAGTATYTGDVPAGSNQLTANFVPTNSGFFAPSSSSAVNYVVAGAASITGTTKVGSKITCAITAGGTITYKWLKNDVEQSGVTTKDVTVPSSWLNGSVKCAATVTKNVNSVTQTSASKTIALGSAPVATTKPKLKGTFKVGKTITCSKGVWNPAPNSYKYAWLRGTKAIKGATKATYKLVTADKGKKIACKVTAVKTGHANGVAKSAAKTIS